MRKEMSFDDPTHCDERMQLVRLEAISWFGLLAPAHGSPDHRQGA
jgi:hypothetical protein